MLRGVRIAAVVDGFFWRSCPDHGPLPNTNASWWRLKFRDIARRDRDTDTRFAAAGWLAVRIWEHEDPGEVAGAIKQLGLDRTTGKQPLRTGLSEDGVSLLDLNPHSCDQRKLRESV